MRRRTAAASLLGGLILALGALTGSAVADTGTESTGADFFPNAGGSIGVQADASYSTNVTAAMVAASSGPIHCSGYGTVASVSSAGHTLSTQENVCGVYYGRDGDNYRWGPVARFKCLRDGVQFGSGTGGCRWKGTVSDWRNGVHDYSVAFQVPTSSNGAYWDDSGRIYGSARSIVSSNTLRQCSDDWIWDRYGIAAGNGVVHFVGTTGVDYGTFNTADRCTPSYFASST